MCGQQKGQNRAKSHVRLTFFWVKKAGHHFSFLKRAGRHQKGAGRRALQKRPTRLNTDFCMSDPFLHVWSISVCLARWFPSTNNQVISLSFGCPPSRSLPIIWCRGVYLHCPPIVADSTDTSHPFHFFLRTCCITLHLHNLIIVSHPYASHSAAICYV